MENRFTTTVRQILNTVPSDMMMYEIHFVNDKDETGQDEIVMQGYNFSLMATLKDELLDECVRTTKIKPAEEDMPPMLVLFVNDNCIDFESIAYA